MFRCQVTGKVSAPKEKMLKVVTGSRPQQYTNTRTDPFTRETYTVESKGWEIVSELRVSQEGYDQLEKTTQLAERGKDGRTSTHQ